MTEKTVLDERNEEAIQRHKGDYDSISMMGRSKSAYLAARYNKRRRQP